MIIFDRKQDLLGFRETLDLGENEVSWLANIFSLYFVYVLSAHVFSLDDPLETILNTPIVDTHDFDDCSHGIYFSDSPDYCISNLQFSILVLSILDFDSISFKFESA